MTSLNKFRAAYDFFYIRSLIDPDLEKFADKWYEIQKTVKSKKIMRKRNYNGKRKKR